MSIVGRKTVLLVGTGASYMLADATRHAIHDVIYHPLPVCAPPRIDLEARTAYNPWYPPHRDKGKRWELDGPSSLASLIRAANKGLSR